MRKPKTLDLEPGGWAECVNANHAPAMKGRMVGLGMVPWLTAPQCRRLAHWLVRAAEWIEAQEKRQ